MQLSIPVILLWFALLVSGWAQGPIQFSAEIRADRLLPRQSVEIIYTLKNAEGSDFRPPDFAPFQVLQGPSISNSLQIINGNRSSSVSYSFVLAAPAPGQYEIPAAEIQVQGNILRSNAVAIEVVSANTAAGQSREQEVFARYELSTDSPYVGEPVVLDLVLYSKKRVHNVYKRSNPDRNAWYSVNFPVRPPPRKTVVHGQAYNRQVINRELLYGQKAGAHAIDRLYLQVDLESESDSRSSPFSFFRSYDRKDVYVADTMVWVQPLPLPAPEEFSGLVGEPQIQGQLKKGQVNEGDAVEYSVRLESTSDPNIVEPPRIIAEGSEVLAPQLRDETREDLLNGRKYIYIYDYLIVPDSIGAQKIYPAITYFNTKNKQYSVASGSPQDLWVSEKSSENKGAPPTDSSEEGVIRTSDENDSSLLNNWWLYIAVLIGLLVLVVQFQKKRNGNQDSDKSPEREFDQLIQADRPDPKALRTCLLALVQKEKGVADEQNEWQEYLKELDYLVYSPSSGAADWDEILSKWRSQRRQD